MTAKKPVNKGDDVLRRPFSAPDPKAEWGGFIDIKLTDEQKKEYRRWMTEGAPTDMWNLFTDTLAQGVRFSLSWDADNDCFTAAFTASVTSMEGRRCSLTARADAWETAVYLLVWKHVFLMEGDWGNYRPRTGFKAEV